MKKLFITLFFVAVFLALFSSIGNTQPYSPTWDAGTDYAGMCHLFSDGMDCREATAEDVDEVCWCTKMDTWIYCGCLQPSMMAESEWLEYLLYRGKPSETQI